MKRVIRRETWETNSSTTHSVVIMSHDQYERWEHDGLYYFNPSDWWNPFDKLPTEQHPIKGALYTKSEVIEFIKLLGEEEELEEYLEEEEYEDDDYGFDRFVQEDDFFSYIGWTEDEYLETDETFYTTPGGEEIVICCKYGRDG